MSTVEKQWRGAPRPLDDPIFMLCEWLLCWYQWLLHNMCLPWYLNAIMRLDSSPCQDLMLFCATLTTSWLSLLSIFILEHVHINNSGW